MQRNNNRRGRIRRPIGREMPGPFRPAGTVPAAPLGHSPISINEIGGLDGALAGRRRAAGLDSTATPL